MSSAANALPRSWAFRVDLDRLAASVDVEKAMERAARVANAEYEAYRSEWKPLPRDTQDWATNPGTGFVYPSRHWFEMHGLIARLNPSNGDVKDVWEPARFGWVFDLIRGFAISRDERFVEAFWRSFEPFAESAPPFDGVHWTCGQETSIRALSLLWAEAAFDGAHASSTSRRTLLQRMLITSGERVADAIDYGVSQRNNHGISEAAGLIAIGARVAGNDPRATRWIRTGRRWLEHCIRDQFADDGWYVQHSFTYLRVALDQALVAERVLRSSARDGLSAPAIARLSAAVRLLIAVHDPATGDVPNHGANDGALVLPISTARYRDFRPSITAAAAVFGVPLPYGVAPCSEALAWLSADAPGSRDPHDDVVGGPSGWIAATHDRVRVFARAGRYTSRPSHIDPAHVDVWIDGHPVAIDAGTFRYSAPAPWKNGLNGIEVHNTVSIPEWPAVRKGPRFLWLGQPNAAVLGWRRLSSGAVAIDVSNETWSNRGAVHSRKILLESDRITVTDEIEGVPAGLDIVLHWLIADGRPLPEVICSVPDVRRVEIRGVETSVFGWHSPEYSRKLPATSVRMTATSAGTVGSRLTFTTVFRAPEQPLHALHENAARSRSASR